MSDPKVPQFDGSEERFVIWMARFRAYCNVKGYGRALDYEDTTDMGEEADVWRNYNSTDDDEKSRGIRGKKNMQLIGALTLAFQSEDLISKVHESATDEWPGGF